MRKINAEDRSLRWVRPDGPGRRFELRSGGEKLATLAWQRWGSRAVAETATKSWTLRLKGGFRSMVIVIEAVSVAEKAVFHPGWLGRGRLVMADGRTFEWPRERLTGGRRTFSSAAGPLLWLSYSGGLGPLEGSAEVTSAGSGERDLLLLLTVGWYLMAQAVYSSP